MFAAFSEGLAEAVSHEEVGTCGVAIDDAFILITKQFPKSLQYLIMFEDKAVLYLPMN
jgi:hypothetical protein